MNTETVLALAFAFGSPAPAVPPAQPAVMKYATVTKNVVSTRAATGQHTHTCPNNNCPDYKEFGIRETWDHAANSGHTCPFCNTEQKIQDPVKRPVTILRTVKVIDFANTPKESLPPYKPLDPPPLKKPPLSPAFQAARSPASVAINPTAFVLPQASSACANGQCSTVQRGRFR